ncbi:OprO/OprP family phosphate-selective porin [Lysobacter cavernae]|uniref:OprO/OprP family phosphate-selective porin n=1 Tax=Lysobacter cavernae TaxID=1685901 RepID=A0ABV7RJT2_9GAMM
MKLSRSTLSVALLAALVAPAAHAEVAIDVIGGSEVSFEGLVQADANWFNSDVANLNGDAIDGQDSDNELRRAEIVLKGKGPDNIEWVLGYDAKADKYLDANIKYKMGGDSNHFVQVGQFKQPNSLEELSSTKNNDFISKAMVTNTFAVARRLGGAYSYGTNDWSLTASYFSRELTRNLAHGNGFGVRGTWAPINESGNVLHLGLSYVDMDTDADTLRLRTRPQADLASVRLVDSGNLTNADRQMTIGAEAFYATGPFKVQGEYMQSTVERYNNGNPLQSQDMDGNSWYVSGLWNITGETWGYKSGVPTTGLPSEPASGMWQVGLRYDSIDLDDGSLLSPTTPTGAPRVDGVLGGEMDAWTAGVNWYWRSNFKFMLNYVKVTSTKYSSSARNFVDDDPSIVEARVQFYW